jgi:hypothetical protein
MRSGLTAPVPRRVAFARYSTTPVRGDVERARFLDENSCAESCNDCCARCRGAAVVADCGQIGADPNSVSPRQLRQLGDVGGDAPGLAAGEEVRHRATV